MSSATSKNPEEVLETYFEKYPDVPKEVTLKHHLLSLGHWFSDAALKAGELLDDRHQHQLFGDRRRLPLLDVEHTNKGRIVRQILVRRLDVLRRRRVGFGYPGRGFRLIRSWLVLIVR